MLFQQLDPSGNTLLRRGVCQGIVTLFWRRDEFVPHGIYSVVDQSLAHSTYPTNSRSVSLTAQLLHVHKLVRRHKHAKEPLPGSGAAVGVFHLFDGEGGLVARNEM